MPFPRLLCLVLLCPSLLFSTALAQPPGQGAPAAVEVAEVGQSRIAPTATFVGTVTYPEISSVAAEVEGRVASVRFDDGHHVDKGEPLVVLDAELLRKEIESVSATRDQVRTDLEKAGLDTERYRALLEDRAVSRQEYEDHLYRQRSLSQNVRALSAQLASLNVQLARKTILAPFAGVVIERLVDPGEWLNPGTAVANLARNDEIEILVSVPEELTALLHRGRTIGFETAAGKAEGAVQAVVPSGDLKTRTFPVKIRAPNTQNLLQGMEARVHLPAGQDRETFVVPRDALVRQPGHTTIFLVSEGTARPVEVKVTAYLGRNVGVAGEGLSKGAMVVVKGNERLRPGQPVQIISAGK